VTRRLPSRRTDSPLIGMSAWIAAWANVAGIAEPVSGGGARHDLFARAAVTAWAGVAWMGVSGGRSSRWCRCSRLRSWSFVRLSACGGSGGRTSTGLTGDTAWRRVSRGTWRDSVCINSQSRHLHLQRCTTTSGSRGDGGLRGGVTRSTSSVLVQGDDQVSGSDPIATL
jgi:hypothetical protein